MLWNVLPVYSVHAIDAIIYIHFFFHFQIRLYSKGHSNGPSYSHRIHCVWLVCWLFMAFWMPIATHLFSSFSIRFQLMPDCGVYRFIRMYVWHHVVIDIVFALKFIASIYDDKCCDFYNIQHFRFASLHTIFSSRFLHYFSLSYIFTCAKFYIQMDIWFL